MFRPLFISLVVPVIIAAQSWDARGPQEVWITDIAASSGGTLLAGTTLRNGNFGYGFYRSTDAGETWGPVNAGLAVSSGTYGVGYSVAVKNDTVYASYLEPATAQGRLYRSTNSGTQWTAVTPGTLRILYAGYVSEGRIYVTPNGVHIHSVNVLYSSYNGGQNWTASKVAKNQFTGLAVDGPVMYIVSDTLFKSTDEGKNWSVVLTNLSQGGTHYLNGKELIARNDTLFSYMVNGIGTAHRSVDGGKTWQLVTDAGTGLTAPNGGIPTVSRMIWTDAGIYAGIAQTGLSNAPETIKRSTDNGATWHPIPSLAGYSEPQLNSLCTVNGQMFAGLGLLGLHRSLDGGVSFHPFGRGLPARVYVNAMLTDGDTVYAAANRWGLLRSGDGAATWSQSSGGLGYTINFNALALSGDTLFAGTAGSGVARSFDRGRTWRYPSNAQFMYGKTVSAVVKWGTAWYAGVKGSGVQRSQDSGHTWSAMNAGWSTADIHRLVVHNGALFMSANNGVHRWTDTSTVWQPVGKDSLGTAAVQFLASAGGMLAAGSYGSTAAGGKLSVSTDQGNSWKGVYTGAAFFNYLSGYASAGSRLFVSTSAKKLFVSTDGGTQWNDITGDLPPTFGALRVSSASQSGPYTVIGVNDASNYGYSTYRTSHPLLSAEGPRERSTIVSFALEQNFPNPFNPSTTLRYSLAVRGPVSLTVYDAAGREVGRLAEGVKEAGTHTIRFDAAGLPSGTYFCALSAGGGRVTRKMLLLK